MSALNFGAQVAYHLNDNYWGHTAELPPRHDTWTERLFCVGVYAMRCASGWDGGCSMPSARCLRDSRREHPLLISKPHMQGLPFAPKQLVTSAV
jgi:hypothetical protein